MLKENKNILLAILLVMVLIASAFTAGALLRPDDGLNTVHVERVFLDVNADGLPDLVLSAEVILNRPLSLPSP